MTQVTGGRSTGAWPAAQGPPCPRGPQVVRALAPPPWRHLLRPGHRLQVHSYAKQSPNKNKKPDLGVLSAIAQRSGAPESVINPKAHAKQSPTDPLGAGTRLQAVCHASNQMSLH